MKKENSKNIVKWDFNYSNKYEESPYTQIDWNQTLATRINQCSNEIHINNNKFGADTIRFNSKILKLIKTLGYFNSEENTLGERYSIVIDDEINEDEIYVYNKLDKELFQCIEIVNYTEDIIYDIKDNIISLLKEDLECVHLYLDDLKIKRKDSNDNVYSIVGRIKELENKYYKELSELETHYLTNKK